MMFMCDIASGAVTDFRSTISKHKMYKQELKHLCSKLQHLQTGYTQQFNLQLRKSMETWVDYAEQFENFIMPHYNTLYQAYVNAFLAAKIPEPYLTARLMYCRDTISIAWGNYQAWSNYVKTHCPATYRYSFHGSFAYLNISTWGKVMDEINKIYKRSLGIGDDIYTVDMSQVHLAHRIISTKIADFKTLISILDTRKGVKDP